MKLFPSERGRIVATLWLLSAAPIFAAPSPLGHWRTIDDKTGKPKSLVSLYSEGGKLYGSIDSLFPAPGKDPDPICDKCPGDLHNKRVKGIRFLWGLSKEGDEWTGGEVLDPANGKIYRCKIKVAEGNHTLVIRGYIGISLLGRSQTWQRVD